MPYVISRPPAKRSRALFARLALVGACAMAATAMTAAPALADTSSCSDPSLAQPFLTWGDSNWYTLAPGESADSFAGTGWTLNGGASIQQTQLADGTTGNVLDLPAGSTAVSPPMCVSSLYPTGRAMVQQASGHGAVLFSVSYQDPNSGNWSNPQVTGWLHGSWGGNWVLSSPLNLQPGSGSNWEMVQFTFTSVGWGGADSQVYNFYVDPYAKG
jgi:hypothetical protein